MDHACVQQEERRAPETSFSINSLINACNKNDRFKLLEDDTVLPGNLNNSIHTIFAPLEKDEILGQALRLASQFLLHRNLLEFFVPLLLGSSTTKKVDGIARTYLLNPLTHAIQQETSRYIEDVRNALHCLAHSISFRPPKPNRPVFAYTKLSSRETTHSLHCTFRDQKHTVEIQIAETLLSYYRTPIGYTSASRCAQFRHDFLFATTLMHEIVHAIGIMRRGNLQEPLICAEAPETEWGYAWEHFMFGSIINPQDRSRRGTHILVGKVWADQAMIDAAGGKEYYDFPMVYIAQWFRRETWKLVAEGGPAVVSPPVSRFKIQASSTMGGWTVKSDYPDVEGDIVALRQHWEEDVMMATMDERLKSECLLSTSITFKFQRRHRLQVSDIKTCPRFPLLEKQASSCGRSNLVTLPQPVSEPSADPIIPKKGGIAAVGRSASLFTWNSFSKKRYNIRNELEHSTMLLKRLQSSARNN